MNVFILYRDSPERRAALAAPVGSPERHLLHGLDSFAAAGLTVRHSLEPEFAPGSGRRRLARLLNRLVAAGGGYGGDFATVLACRSAANRADVVLSTVDTVGLPLVLLRVARLVRPPLVYLAIGLPERLARLRGRTARAVYRRALAGADAILAFGHAEADGLRAWLGPEGERVSFVPFGVDPDAFRLADATARGRDILSVGSDPHRDFELLLDVARRRPAWNLEIVTSISRARQLAPLPPNVRLTTEVPLAVVVEKLGAAAVVALPVRENTYSGATTTLLQALALGCPVVVSRTAAIAKGYGLVDGVNCRLVAPGDGAALESALADLLDRESALELGREARRLVETSLSWQRYVETLRGHLSAVATGSRSGA